MSEKIYAGLDTDAVAKLFFVDEKGNTRNITHKDWLTILDWLGADPGEMVLVELRREHNVQRTKNRSSRINPNSRR